jgi:hypothetical protein
MKTVEVVFTVRGVLPVQRDKIQVANSSYDTVRAALQKHIKDIIINDKPARLINLTSIVELPAETA